jgi:hypothetical protein
MEQKPPEKNDRAADAVSPQGAAALSPVRRFRLLTKRLLSVPVAEVYSDKDGSSATELPRGRGRRVKS